LQTGSFGEKTNLLFSPASQLLTVFCT